VIVQIYEIQTPEEAEACIEVGVDHIGSVLFSEDGWRRPLLKKVIQLSKSAGVKNSIIPLFHAEDILLRALEYYQPAYLHFCETLTTDTGAQQDFGPMVERQGRLKEEFPETGIIRTIPIPGIDSVVQDLPVVEMARAFEGITDFFLIDTWVEKAPVNGFIGITGRPPQWDMAKDLVFNTDTPVILAGGLSPENVYGALLKVLPAGADSCTQTNRLDESGQSVRLKKDMEKVKKFVGEVRRAEVAIRHEAERMTLKVNELKEALSEGEAALPAHSIRPHQLLAIEELEEEIALQEKKLKHLK
jgi:phosphoribosylanthranilate isomerase